MTWSPQQEAALKLVEAWIDDESPSSPQVFRLFGFAGTGKTMLAKEIAKMARKVKFGAFTGKAALVMRRKGCYRAQTIHSMIYMLDDTTGPEPKFVLDEDSEVRDADLVILDECSMIDAEIGKDLLSFGTKILVIGDPAQLPPVKGAGFFTDAKPDFMLTEVHRQAQENPIIALSMQIRAGKPLALGSYGNSKVIKRCDITSGEILVADQIIVGMNKTRHRYNDRIRELKGLELGRPVKGDKLVCLRNDRKKGIFNGGLWTVDKAKKKGQNFALNVTALDDDRDVPSQKSVYVRKEFFTGDESLVPWQELKGKQQFTFGYALTCHKSQGSQWNNIIIFDESGAFREDSRRWLYTAVTRAAEQMTLVRLAA